MRARGPAGAIIVLSAVAFVLPPGASTAAARPPTVHASGNPLEGAPADVSAAADGDTEHPPRWAWPVRPPRISEPYRAPAHAYGEGHRGIDLAAAVGSPVTSPDDGMVAFAGTVVDRGILTIDHGGGLVSTLEPVEPLVAAGAVVRAGDVVATVGTGGHTRTGELHLGAREDGAYITPLRLLSEVPRAILLPCCDAPHDPG
ncbi:murein hydrolase activator EnvC family protein [Microbacterium hominis]|uniref:murein hydrolase activator EnvC family protein n=1 Tax=Microbacterium hominis TaxID=162426 RepID=UPI0009E6C8EF|nr:M23 family metallopeptidase [Microbacterium hominis]